jgi:hypothetical protein
MKRIPSTFELGGNHWKVEWSETLLKEQKCYGITHYDTNTILLQRPIRRKYTMQNVMQVFWHEYFHASFMTLNHLKLSRDEKLVDQRGHLMAQFFKTAN